MKRHNSSPIFSSSNIKYRRCYTPIPSKFDQNVSSLLNLSSKVVAETIPYELIENRKPAIPDQLQHKIIFYSFPRKEEDIYIYSSYGLQEKTSDPNKKLSFYQGVTLLEKNLVQNVMQIGFHLNGEVQDHHKASLISRKSDSLLTFHVSVTFDRCKITSVDCSCSHQGLFWCPHIVALALFRIRRPECIQFREPISESLVRMDRDQLQKFAQYLIASHPNQVLSSAQNLVDQLLETGSKINQIYGAPDPTAGAGLAEPQPQWHLNETQIRDQLGHLLGAVSVGELPSGLSAMTEKVVEMLRVQDRNGARLLSLVTEEGLRDPRLAIFKMRQAEMWPSYRQLWEELARLWVCVVLCPLSSSPHRRASWRRQLHDWSSHDNCPPEDWDYAGGSSSVFRLALLACDMTWDDPRLQEILGEKACHAWAEQLPLACLRVLALRSNGLCDEAVRLALAIARSLISQRHQQTQTIITHAATDIQTTHDDSVVCATTTAPSDSSPPSFFASITASSPPISPLTTPCIIPESGWLGLVGNPIRVLVQCLLLAFSPKAPPYQHHPVSLAPDLPDRSYLTLALRLALLALCQLRTMPPQKHKQERCLNNEAKLLELLGTLPRYDPDLSLTLSQALQHEMTLTYGSALSPNVPSNIYPMHTAGVFFFKWLMLFDQDLAYKLVNRAMRLPLLESHSDQQTLTHSHHTSTTTGPHQPIQALPTPSTDDEPSSNMMMAMPPPPLFPTLYNNGAVSLDTASSNNANGSNSLVSYRRPMHHSNRAQNNGSSSTRWPVLRRIENSQCELALTMVTAARDSSQKLDLVLKLCDRHIHSSTSLFKLSQDICSKSFMNAHLRCAVFHLALNVAGRTLGRSHWRRREMVSWLISCAVGVGGVGIAHLLAHWPHYVSPKEAVLQVASALLGLTPMAPSVAAVDERVRGQVRRMAVEAAAKDPVHCGMRALSLMEKDPAMFEATYQAIRDAAERGAIGPPDLFALGRYLEPRHNWRGKAYSLAMLAVAMLPPAPADPPDHDISWACLLAHSLGPEPLSEMLAQVVRKVRSPLLLADVLHRCRHSPIRPSKSAASKVFLSLSEPPLQLLLSATIEAFFSATQLRLANISPRHYTDFLDFLYKARDVFLLIVPDGSIKFRQLIDSIRQSHRGKRKLNFLLKERFLFDTSSVAIGVGSSTHITNSSNHHHNHHHHVHHQHHHQQHPHPHYHHNSHHHYHHNSTTATSVTATTTTTATNNATCCTGVTSA